MNTKSTLTLRLPAEAMKVMPHLVRAKMLGKPKLIESVRGHFKAELAKARHREESQRRREQEREWQEQLRAAEHEALKREAEKAEAWRLEEEKRVAWIFRDTHFYLGEDDELEFLPRHSSNKGFRRLLSEHPDLRESRRYGQWGENSNNSLHKLFHRLRRCPSIKWEYVRSQLCKLRKLRKRRTFRDYR